MSVSITDFGKLTTGQPVQLVTLKNDKIEVQLLTYAAIIHRIIVPDRKGSPTDVVLGYPTARDYELNTDSMGAAVGRFANRIGGAQFPLYEAQQRGQLPAQWSARLQPRPVHCRGHPR